MMTDSTMVERLERFASEAMACEACEGAQRWYFRTRRTILAMAERYGVDGERAIVASAILSTNATVAAQLQNTERALRDGAEAVLHFGDVKRRVALALSGDFDGALDYKRGRKIVRFADNLRFPWRQRGGTMDRHQCRILVGGCPECAKNLLARKDGYAVAEAAHDEVAARFGMRTSELQARTWVHLVSCHEGTTTRCGEHG